MEMERRIRKKMRWRRKYVTNVPILDHQHRQFFILVRTVEQLSKKNKSRKIIKMVLDEIVNYTVFHFKTEEKVLEEAGYPGLEAHKKEHIRFTHTIQQKVLKANVFNKDVIDRSLFNFLLEWMTNHIILDDWNHCQYTKKQIQLKEDNQKLKDIIAAGPPTSPFQNQFDKLKERARRAEGASTEEIEAEKKESSTLIVVKEKPPPFFLRCCFPALV
eukprot:TRINITY_DN2361_c0_g1_i2.p1 TRINITY_DN2361_c0_g1~~TRINITY_DN2361_c0_g1_i2.p1  ORF type:complete len:216 (+),score=54.62 TRINITY_DN2361_c0_g1_i2:88-735(+)